MSLHPEVRAFLDERNRADPDIDYSRIAAPGLRARFAIPVLHHRLITTKFARSWITRH